MQRLASQCSGEDAQRLPSAVKATLAGEFASCCLSPPSHLWPDSPPPSGCSARVAWIVGRSQNALGTDVSPFVDQLTNLEQTLFWQGACANTAAAAACVGGGCLRMSPKTPLSFLMLWPTGMHVAYTAYFPLLECRIPPCARQTRVEKAQDWAFACCLCRSRSCWGGWHRSQQRGAHSHWCCERKHAPDDEARPHRILNTHECR